MANFTKIKLLARKKGITLHQLAQELGLSPTTISKIMRENSTSARTLQALCDYFGVSADYFFTDDDNYPTMADTLYDGRPQDIIKKRLEDMDMSVGELARLMDTSQQRMWYTLHSASSIKASDLKKMCEILQLDYLRMSSTGVKVDNPSSYRQTNPPLPTASSSTNDEDMEFLKEQIRLKDEQIKMLMDMLNKKSNNGFTYTSKRCGDDPF